MVLYLSENLVQSEALKHLVLILPIQNFIKDIAHEVKVRYLVQK